MSIEADLSSAERDERPKGRGARVWEFFHPLLWLAMFVVFGYFFMLFVRGVDEAKWAGEFVGWIGRFTVSPGAAGLAAVVAAWIGVSSIGRQLRHNKNVDRDSSWWKGFEWVTGKALPVDGDEALPAAIALGMLGPLDAAATSEVQQHAVSGMADYLTPFVVAQAEKKKAEEARRIEALAETETNLDATGDEPNTSSPPPTDAATRDSKGFDQAIDDAAEQQRDALKRISATLEENPTLTRVNALLATSPKLQEINSQLRSTFQNYSKQTRGSAAQSAAVENQLYRMNVDDALERVLAGRLLPRTAWVNPRGYVVRSDSGQQIHVHISKSELSIAAHEALAPPPRLLPTTSVLVVEQESPFHTPFEVVNGVFSVRWRDKRDDDGLRQALRMAGVDESSLKDPGAPDGPADDESADAANE